MKIWLHFYLLSFVSLSIFSFSSLSNGNCLILVSYLVFSHLKRLLREDWFINLTCLWRGPLSYRNQSIDLQSKSVDWFLYDNGLRHERVKVTKVVELALFKCDVLSSPSYFQSSFDNMQSVISGTLFYSYRTALVEVASSARWQCFCSFWYPFSLYLCLSDNIGSYYFLTQFLSISHYSAQ